MRPPREPDRRAEPERFRSRADLRGLDEESRLRLPADRERDLFLRCLERDADRSRRRDLDLFLRRDRERVLFRRSFDLERDLLPRFLDLDRDLRRSFDLDRELRRFLDLDRDFDFFRFFDLERDLDFLRFLDLEPDSDFFRFFDLDRDFDFCRFFDLESDFDFLRFFDLERDNACLFLRSDFLIEPDLDEAFLPAPRERSRLRERLCDAAFLPFTLAGGEAVLSPFILATPSAEASLLLRLRPPPPLPPDRDRERGILSRWLFTVFYLL